MPHLVVDCRSRNPVGVPIILHHREIYPLRNESADPIKRVWTRSYLLVRRVGSPLRGNQMTTSILPRDAVSHGTFEGARIDQGHVGRSVESRGLTNKLLNRHNPDVFGYIGSRGTHHATLPRQQPTHTPFMITTTSRPYDTCLPFFPMHSFLHVSHLYVFPFSLRLTWLANPALVTSVYPNRM